MGTKEQAEALEKAQLMAMFGETPESVDKLIQDPAFIERIKIAEQKKKAEDDKKKSPTE